jgi:hypothetical protein
VTRSFVMIDTLCQALASTRKDIPGEEERNFLYNPVPSDQEASIRDGMKFEARAL